MVWQNPKTDWADNPKNPRAEDFNRIEGNIDFLKQEIETKKGAIVDALNSVGITTSINETHDQIAAKIIAAEKKGVVITPGTVNKLIPKGIYHDEGYVAGDADLVAANIKSGVNIFGVQGNSNVVDTSGGDVLASDILVGKKVYSKGSLITGTMRNNGAIVAIPRATDQNIISGYHNGSGIIKGDPNLIGANVIVGKSIFGVNGAALRVSQGTYNFSQTEGAYWEGSINNTITGIGFTPQHLFIIRNESTPYIALWITQNFGYGIAGGNQITFIEESLILGSTTKFFLRGGSRNTVAKWIAIG